MKSNRAAAASVPSSGGPTRKGKHPTFSTLLKSRFAGLLTHRPGAVQVLLVALILWVIGGALPTAPFPIATGIDASWNYGLNIIHAKSIPFGDHVVFTMGPLGYLATPDPDYTPAAAVLVLRWFAYVLFVWGIARCAIYAGLEAALTVAVVLSTQMLLAQHYPDVWQAAYLSVFIAAAASSGRSLADLVLAAIATGVTLLFKLNEGATAAAVFVCLVGYSFWRSRTSRNAHVALAVTPVVMLFAGMQILQGSFTAAFPYIWYSMDMMGGYSRSVGITGPVWQVGLAVLYLMLILLMPLALGDKTAFVRPGLAAALLVAFVGFKHGMVRQDGHADMVQVKIAAAALFLMVAAVNVRDRRVFACLALFGAAFTGCIVYDNQRWLIESAQQRLRPIGIVRSGLSLISFGASWEAVRATMHRNLAPLRLDTRFHQIIGNQSVDAFPENIDAIRANGWNYHPRPNLQSSASYTQRLDERTAQYLRSSAASRFALFIWYAIDGRHPFLQDPQSLSALLDSYELVHADERATLLSRRPQPLKRSVQALGTVEADWDRPVFVPPVEPGQAVLGRIRIEPRLRGKIRAFLFRASPVFVTVTYKDGQQQGYRVVPENIDAGAIVSPLPRNSGEFTAMLQSEPPFGAAQVSTLAWTCNGCSDYGDKISISWERTPLPVSAAGQSK